MKLVFKAYSLIIETSQFQTLYFVIPMFFAKTARMKTCISKSHSSSDIFRLATTVRNNPILGDLNTTGTSKLDWRHFEHNKIDRNELQIHKNLQKGTGTKTTEDLTILKILTKQDRRYSDPKARNG